jgi:hypothetical protein
MLASLAQLSREFAGLRRPFPARCSKIASVKPALVVSLAPARILEKQNSLQMRCVRSRDRNRTQLQPVRRLTLTRHKRFWARQDHLRHKRLSSRRRKHQDAEESWTDEERSALSAHIEEGYLQAERGEFIDGAQAQRDIQAMKDIWHHERSAKQ